MRGRKKVWLAGAGLALGIAGAVFIADNILSRRVEPYIRQQAVEYLRQRFDSEVELSTFRVRLPKTTLLRVILARGRRGIALVEGENLVLRHKGRHDIPPLFRMRHFSFEVDLDKLLARQKSVPLVEIDGLELTIPAKRDHPRVLPEARRQVTSDQGPPVQIDSVLITHGLLVILPKDSKKVPLRFDIHRVQLNAASDGTGMTYSAALTNPRPPGEIMSQGTFGPWVGDEPGDSPLAGAYTFDKADLGVFAGIAGILRSTGAFQGTLNSITVRGEASVRDFRLTMAGQVVPLFTRFEALVDGTNGNTVLKPLQATLGASSFTTSGSVIKHDGDITRSIALDVHMPRGKVGDLLRLATKGPPFMDGDILLETKIDIPPLTGKVRDKLIVDGRFEVTGGRFLRSTIQDQIDTLSRRGQGQPKNEQIDEVVSYMEGEFHFASEGVTFRNLSFGVPGASVELSGNYKVDSDAIDFHGSLRLQAKVSRTMSGWKRLALRPIDPLFSKRGAGTLLPIRVTGGADHPKFGLDRSPKQH